MNSASEQKVPRRNFVRTLLGGVAGASVLLHARDLEAGQEPVRRLDGSKVLLGIAAYSFRKHFEFMKGKAQTPDGDQKIDMFGFIDYCAKHNCGAELTSYFFPPDADDKYFLKVKRHAFVNGIPIVGTAIGNNFTLDKGVKLDAQIADAKRWIDNAVLMGAPHVRFFAGTAKQLESKPGVMKNAIEALQHCADYAATKGVFIGVENHGKLTADQVLEVVKGVKSEWFGVNLDTGNFISDDPYADLAACLPYAVNIQLKMKMKRPDGSHYDADFGRLAKLINDSNYRGFVVLEYEETEPFDNVPVAFGQVKEVFGVD